MEAYYEMIFKRKSVRKFGPELRICAEELAAIELKIAALEPLDESFPKAMRVTQRKKTTCKWGEYCLLYYGGSTVRDRLNAGYMLEQMDLFLASMDIGACWYGLARPDQTRYEGLKYVIMLAFGKSRTADFRTDLRKISRKPIGEVWQGAFDETVAAPARLAPSACNMQPWRVKSENGVLRVFRTTDVRSAIMPVFLRPFYNTIDLGIFLCILEISLAHGGYGFTRILYGARGKDPLDKRLTPIAQYALISSPEAKP